MCRLARRRWHCNEITDEPSPGLGLGGHGRIVALLPGGHRSLGHLTYMDIPKFKKIQSLDNLRSGHVTPVHRNYLIVGRSDRFPSSLGCRHIASLPAPVLLE